MITWSSGIKGGIRWLTRRIGWELVRYRGDGLPPDFEPLHREIVKAVRPYTLTSPERLFGLIEGVRYVARHDVPGAFAECGVYKGGSMMAVALTLLEVGVRDRDLYLYDTYEGMPAPTEEDVDHRGIDAREHFERTRTSDRSSDWLACSIERVREAVLSTGYPAERIHLVKGVVQETLPDQAPEQIALLRLDTDWYASTRHELETLYPRLAPRGVLIVDDYGHFQGARKAVDEYFEGAGIPVLLGRLDYTGRMLVKEG